MKKLYTEIRPEEKEAIIEAIRTINGQVSSVASVAKIAGMNPNRARFVVDELQEENKIARKVAKRYNEHYVRYTYEVVK